MTFAIKTRRSAGQNLRHATLFLLLGVLLAFAAAAAENQCRETSLAGAPSWVFSGAWDEQTDDGLILVDVLKRQLVEFDMGGLDKGPIRVMDTKVLWDVAAEKAALAGEAPNKFRPILIKKGDSGYFVTTETGYTGGDTIWALTDDFQFHAATAVSESPSKTGNGSSLEAIYEFTPVGGDAVLTFGDVKHADGSWASGFQLVHAGFVLRFEDLYSFGPRSQYKGYYTLGRNMMCSIGDTAYALVLHEGGEEPSGPKILAVAAQGVEKGRSQRSAVRMISLANAMPEFSSIEPAEWLFSRNLVTHFAAAAAVNSPSGLYCFGDSLFVLGQQPSSAGTSWSLTKIEPDSGAALGHWTLPANSPHLIVVPGDDHWAFLAKGDVEEFGQQSLESAYLWPASWLTDADNYRPENDCSASNEGHMSVSD